ncbi:MAG: 2-oxoacid:ferredoxin oxidoreductase subunit beta [Chloroflexota bacterium]|nr:MAG: 2-oxoacid:ferredoxin oxidoreductase subunit beta [Chloroflexota bacterium]
MVVQTSGAAIAVESHPADGLLRADRLPHIWCPGCGIGTATDAFVRALSGSSIPIDRHVCVSGIGCTGRVAGYLNLDSFHTTHGRAIPFATGLKMARADLAVTVFSGDGDLFAIGGNHFLHAARRNIDLNVICVNNFNYGMTGGQGGPTTPVGSRTTTTQLGNREAPLNLPYFAAATGAVFVARWTVLHVRQLQAAFERALAKRGFRFIEVLAPCPISYGKSNDLGAGIDEMELYRRHCVVDDGVDLARAQVDLTADAPIYLGNFVDVERPVFQPVRASTGG